MTCHGVDDSPLPAAQIDKDVGLLHAALWERTAEVSPSGRFVPNIVAIEMLEFSRGRCGIGRSQSEDSACQRFEASALPGSPPPEPGSPALRSQKSRCA